MLPSEISDLAFVIDSISINRPTEREIKEHRERLEKQQSHLNQLIATLRKRLSSIRDTLKYGLVSPNNMSSF
jgi:hypothetical protein